MDVAECLVDSQLVVQVLAAIAFWIHLVSQGKSFSFSDVVTAQMSQWAYSRSSAQRDCRWSHDQLQLGIDSHDAQHLIVHIAKSLQRISLKAEEVK